MLNKSDISIAETLARFNTLQLDVGFLVPTETALKKSIMDAHNPLREYLERNDIHDFSDQEQGEKIILSATLLQPVGAKETTISLYRPKTKTGDPRIWIYGLKQIVNSYNLVAIFEVESKLYVVNCSHDLDYVLSDKCPLDLPNKSQTVFYDSVEEELLGRLKQVAEKGFIPTVTEGDTGIGMTLEAELDVKPNALAEPDYKGIELKASRKRHSGTKNRVTMFSKVPNWKLSPVKSAINLLNKRGYVDDNGRLSLYHTMNGKTPNSLGLQLAIDHSNSLLNQVHVSDGTMTHDTSWLLDDLKNSLFTKHPETFWVKAEVKIIDGREHFHYTHATYTKKPKIEYLEMLIEDGVITLDYAMHKRATGNGVRDHGYLFKILPSNFGALFPSPKQYELT